MMPMPGAEHYVKDWSPRRPSKSLAYIDRANTIPVTDVLRDVCGVVVPTGMTAGSWKLFCPFDYEHPDRMKKGFRVYEITNTSYCFVLHGSLRPVRLVQLTRGLRPLKAAWWLLDYYGLSRPRPYKDRYQELLLASEVQRREMGSPANAVEALQVAMSHVSSYALRQFDTDVTACLEKQLEDLDSVMTNRSSDGEVRAWLNRARAQLVQVVEGGSS